MGDTGSQFFGFVAGFSMLLLTQVKTVYSAVIPLYLIGIPFIDTTLVIFERLQQGRSIFRADKNHIHHKLLKMGLRHNESVLVIYTLQLGMILIAWTGRYADNAVLLVSFLLITVVSIYFFTLESKITWVVVSHNNNYNLNITKTKGKKFINFSRKMIERLTFYGLIFLLFLFYFTSPLLIDSVSRSIGFLSLAIIVCLLVLKIYNISHIRLFITIALCFLGIYYIYFTEYSQNSLYIYFQHRHAYNILFFALAMFYIGHVISSYEKIAFTTNDFLMLSIVIFLFFLPNDYDWPRLIRSIAVKSFLIFTCLDLLIKKLGTKRDFVLAPAIIALGLNFLVALLPLIL